MYKNRNPQWGPDLRPRMPTCPWAIVQVLIFGAHKPYRDLINTYFRYIDDLMFIVNKDLELDDPLTYFNNNSLNLKFTGEEQSIKVNYLDITFSRLPSRT